MSTTNFPIVAIVSVLVFVAAVLEFVPRRLPRTPDDWVLFVLVFEPRRLPRIPVDWVLVVVASAVAVAVAFGFVTLSSTTLDAVPTVWLVDTGFIDPVFVVALFWLFCESQIPLFIYIYIIFKYFLNIIIHINLILFDMN